MIAGTAIGAGMIALPMTLAKLGVVGSLSLMAVTWFIVYYSALIGTELTFRVKHSMSLNEIARILSGWGASSIAMGCVMILSYALIAAYLYGGSSITFAVLNGIWGIEIEQNQIVQIFAFFMFVVLVLGIKWVDYLNRLMFFALIGILLVTIVGLGWSVNIKSLPLLTDKTFEISTWTVAIPIIFTSFGFQMMIPAMSGYLNRDVTLIKKAFFWGSLIPVGVYLAWTLSTLGTLTTHTMTLFDRVVTTPVDVGEFVGLLSETASWAHLQLFVWGVSIFAIITSAFGVALGLIDLWQRVLSERFNGASLRSITAGISIIPSLLIALLTPGAFIKALGVAGMILVVIAIVLPIYLLFKSDHKVPEYAYKITQSKSLRLVVLTFALGLIGCEVGNLFDFF